MELIQIGVNDFLGQMLLFFFLNSFLQIAP